MSIKDNKIKTVEELRLLYDEPLANAVKKQKSFLDEPSLEFIRQSPFLCLATQNKNGQADCSPKGDPAGFVQISDSKTLLVPDRRGNNRLDSLINIIENPTVGIIFFIPGRNETLRVNGKADISIDKNLRSKFEINSEDFRGRLPTSVLIVHVEEVYFHCPKALIRSELWKRGAKLKPDLKTYIKSIHDQLGEKLSAEEIRHKSENYQKNLKDRIY